MKVTVIRVITGVFGTIPKGLIKELKDMEKNKKTNGDHQDCSIKIGQNTEKSPEDLRLAVTQYPVRNHQLMLVWKTLKRENNNNQAYGCKEKTKHRVANQTRQVEKFYNYINKQ